MEELRVVTKLRIEFPITVKELADKLAIKPNELIKALMSVGIFANINQALDEELVERVAGPLGFEIEKTEKAKGEAIEEEEAEVPGKLIARAPVVTLMGHVDHGKTSLLDYIRKSKLAAKEKGQITQHIGAYQVRLERGKVTFLDTPGHEAFTALRARGVNATDVVVLVVAADDGVKPQTIEAIDHAKAANAPIVIAINKCDLPYVNIEKVRRELQHEGLVCEEWGGKTIMVNVSAKTGEGVDKLLEMLLLEAEMLELKANPHLRGRGVVIEGKLSPIKGPVATVLIKNGTLKIGDVVVSGPYYGKVKAMFDDLGKPAKEAPPAMPVEILGLSDVPEAGEQFYVVKDEKKAKILTDIKRSEERARARSKRMTLEGLYKDIKEGYLKELNIILKGDVQGSIEALSKSLADLGTKEVKVNIIHSVVGNINESDVMLALASNAIIIGFHVKAEPKAEVAAEKEGVDIKFYDIIYEAIADVKAAMEGLLEPIEKEVFAGRAEVQQVFSVTKVGTIAGCLVTKGKIVRSDLCRLKRGGKVVYEGKIGSLKRFKDDVREVENGFECGIGLLSHNDIKAGDIIDTYKIEKVARRLEK